MVRYERDSREINTLVRKCKAFLSSFYSLKAKRRFGEFLAAGYDIVHVHNLYPLLSPSILVAAKQQNVPVVMTVHNQFLTCPVGTNHDGVEICEECSALGERRCIAKNCAASRVMSSRLQRVVVRAPPTCRPT